MGSERVTKAYEDFMIELFGHVPDDIKECSIDRKTYTDKMKVVQARHGLAEGQPDFLEWVLTLVGRSPKFIEEGAGDNGAEQ